MKVFSIKFVSSEFTMATGLALVIWAIHYLVVSLVLNWDINFSDQCDTKWYSCIIENGHRALFIPEAPYPQLKNCQYYLLYLLSSTAIINLATGIFILRPNVTAGILMLTGENSGMLIFSMDLLPLMTDPAVSAVAFLSLLSQRLLPILSFPFC